MTGKIYICIIWSQPRRNYPCSITITFIIGKVRSGGIRSGPAFGFNGGGVEEKSAACYESDCIESHFTIRLISAAPVFSFLSLLQKKKCIHMTHLEALALHGFLLVVSQSRTWAGVSSPCVPSWPGWTMEEWSHPILPLQTWHLVQPYITLYQHWAPALSETQYKEDDGWVGAARGWARSVESKVL